MKQYVLSIIAAAIVCAICRSMIGEKTATGRIVNLISGLMMTITVLSPLIHVSFENVAAYWEGITANAEDYAQDGKTAANESIRSIIKEQAEAYILDKAKDLDLEITVEVELDGGDDPIPCGVTISGTRSPYAKEVLGQFIAETLCIPREMQRWT